MDWVQMDVVPHQLAGVFLLCSLNRGRGGKLILLMTRCPVIVDILLAPRSDLHPSYMVQCMDPRGRRPGRKPTRTNS